MYAEVITGKPLPILYECQACEQEFWTRELTQHCPECLSTDKTNLVVLHLEEDSDRAEWLQFVDVPAGD